MLLSRASPRTWSVPGRCTRGPGASTSALGHLDVARAEDFGRLPGHDGVLDVIGLGGEHQAGLWGVAVVGPQSAKTLGVDER